MPDCRRKSNILAAAWLNAYLLSRKLRMVERPMNREIEQILKQREGWFREQNRRMNEWLFRHRHEHPHFRYLCRAPRITRNEFIIVHSYLTAKLQLGEPGYPGWRMLHEGGFLLWRDKPHPDYVLCDCRAPYLGTHYRLDYERLLPGISLDPFHADHSAPSD